MTAARVSATEPAVAKENLRVEAYGTVDETNSAVGVILGNPALPC